MPGGRPTVMTDTVVTQLKLAFSNGCNDTEACLFAGVSRKVFYEYIQKNPEFSDLRDELRQTPSLVAKQNVVRSIKEGSAEDSKWWLERKNKDEFSIRQETVGKDGAPLIPETIILRPALPRPEIPVSRETLENADGNSDSRPVLAAS